MKKILSILLLSASFISTAALATEPANIAIAKKKLEQYYTSGEYQKL